MSDSDQKLKAALENLARGNDALRKGNFDYAISLLMMSCKLMPEKIEFRRALRDAEYKKFSNSKKGASMASFKTAPVAAKVKFAKTRKKWTEVVECCEEALQHNPWDSSWLLELGKALRELGYGDQAVWALIGATELDKKTKELYVQLAQAYEEVNQFDRAVSAWETVYRIDPKDHDAASKARQLAASATIQKGGYEDADSFKRSMEEQKKSDDVFADSPTAETPETRARKEIAQLEAKLDADPANVGLCVQIGDLYRRLNEYDKAASFFQRGFDATSGADFDIKIRLLETQIEPFKQNRAVIEGRLRSLDRNASDAAEKEKKLKAHYNAFTREILGREIDLYKFRVGVNAQDYTAHFELGKRLMMLNQIDDAIRALQQGRNDTARRWEALYLLGRAFREKNNLSLADKNLVDALADVPSGSEDARKKVLYWRGRVAEERGDAPAALELFNEVAAIDYGYLDVAKRLDSLNS